MAERSRMSYTPGVELLVLPTDTPTPVQDDRPRRDADAVRRDVEGGSAPPPPARWEELVERGRAEIAAERLEDALASFESAERAAEAHGDPVGADRAWLNRCAVLIASQRLDLVDGRMLHRMRSILTAGRDPLNCWLAAYDIAQAYELTKGYRKGLFYARVALDRAELLGQEDWLASSYNQLGNLLLAEGQFEDARDALEHARKLLSATADPVRRSSIEGNLGYVSIVLGDERRGFRLLYSSLRILRRLGRRREQTFAHLDLCFAHLEAGRLRDALRHGMRSLGLSEELGEPVSMQYALFLLGETAQLLGDSTVARRHFLRLQELYFPDNPRLPDILLSVGVRGLVNLKA